MGKIKQGILGGFKGKVGTVIGSSWNGIAYMKGLPQSVKNSKSAAQMVQRDFFKEVQGLASQLTAEQLNFLFPSSPKGMTRRNAIVQQLSADPIIEADSKHVDLANLSTIGNAPTAELPEVTITADRSNITISWDEENDWRTTHADEYPTIFVANVTQKKIFLVNSTVAVGASGEQSFSINFDAFGVGSDQYAGFMLATGSKVALVGFGTMGVTKRPARQGRNPRTGQ